MSATLTAGNPAREAFERLLGELRPKLHRYCARMTGSVIDGEDVVQEAIVKAIEAFPAAGPIRSAEGWLIRIAHNAALDFLRHRARQEAIRSDANPDMISDPVAAVNDRQAVAASLRTFMRLPVAQRSAVILMDVLGYSLDEIGGITAMSIPAVKAALHYGRSRLRELAQEPDDLRHPVLAEPERARFLNYVERFNARDFVALRNMLADDVRLDLVNRLHAGGPDRVGHYFHRYSEAGAWRCAPGFVEGHPAILMFDSPGPPAAPDYFVLLDWTNDRVAAIRDFRYARYATEGAELRVME